MIAPPIREAPPRRHVYRPPNFDRLARIYRWMEWLSFGPWLSHCRRTFLPSLVDRRRALIFGDGDGRFTAVLLRANPRIEIEAIDLSAAMLAQLVRRAGSHACRVRARPIDARSWKPSQATYDLVVTHFFLDCLSADQVASLVTRVGASLSPGAKWVVSEFAIPPGWYGSLVARPLVALLYKAFGWLAGLDTRSLPNYRRPLVEAGFRLREERRILGGLLRAETWEAAGQPAHSAACPPGQNVTTVLKSTG